MGWRSRASQSWFPGVSRWAREGLKPFRPPTRMETAVRTALGATSVSELASAISVRQEEASIVADLKAGSEEAYSWLVTQYHQPIYSLVYRMLDDPADAPDTLQEVFLNVFKGIQWFHGESSL